MHIGYYYRKAFDPLGYLFIALLPIARYLCKRKKKPKIDALTFSLLPNCLIPYYSLTIDDFMKIIADKLNNKHSTILDDLYSTYEEINMTRRTIDRYIATFRQTVLKLKFFSLKNNHWNKDLSGKEAFANVYRQLTTFNRSEYPPGAIGYSDFYYEMEGKYLKNAYFLFGTAYQFL